MTTKKHIRGESLVTVERNGARSINLVLLLKTAKAREQLRQLQHNRARLALSSTGRKV